MEKLYPPECANCGCKIFGEPKVIGTPPKLKLVHDFDCRYINNSPGLKLSDTASVEELRNMDLSLTKPKAINKSSKEVAEITFKRHENTFKKLA